MNSRKTIISVVITFFIIILLILSIKYFNVKVEFGIKPIAYKPPTISFLIMNGEPDEVIRQKILENPSLLHEKCLNELLDLKTPIITAIAYERFKLLQYMIKYGAPVNESREILKESGNEYYISLLDKIQSNKVSPIKGRVK